MKEAIEAKLKSFEKKSIWAYSSYIEMYKARGYKRVFVRKRKSKGEIMRYKFIWLHKDSHKDMKLIMRKIFLGGGCNYF